MPQMMSNLNFASAGHSDDGRQQEHFKGHIQHTDAQLDHFFSGHFRNRAQALILVASTN